MRILIISDTHGKIKNIKRVLEMESPIDLLIHLGDSGFTEQEISEMACCNVEMVAGNCDFFSPLDREKIFYIGKYKIFISHGNFYDVESGIVDIRNAGIAAGADLVMFGHTHRPLIEYGDKITVLNPGSLSMPRQEGKKCSYAVMILDKKENYHLEICYLPEI